MAEGGMTPEDYFDQFIGWADQQVGWPENGQWCPRHWAPCPLQGANGIGVAVDMMARWAEGEMTADPAELNEAMKRTVAEHGAICCALGDTVMLELWSAWPPTRMKDGQIEPFS